MSTTVFPRRNFRSVAEAESAMLELKKQLVDLRRIERDQRLELAYSLIRQVDNYLGHDATQRVIDDLKKQLKASKKVREVKMRGVRSKPDAVLSSDIKPGP